MCPRLMLFRGNFGIIYPGEVDIEPPWMDSWRVFHKIRVLAMQQIRADVVFAHLAYFLRDATTYKVIFS